jgi:hypothetical protein
MNVLDNLKLNCIIKLLISVSSETRHEGLFRTQNIPTCCMNVDVDSDRVSLHNGESTQNPSNNDI